MIRHILLASAGAMALAGTAFAADLPMRAPPPVYLPPPPLWTGFYIGINAGYTWAASQSVQTTAAPLFAAATFEPELALSSALATGSTNVNPNGFIGGGQIGYNYQFANAWNAWVVGLEADIQGIASGADFGTFSGSGVPAGFPGETISSTVVTTKKIDYLGTVRGRIGYLITPTLLIYGDGGLAYGGVNPSTSIFQANTGLGLPPTFASFGSISKTQVGWAAGGGVEWMFLPNLSAKVEYFYYDLGKVSRSLGVLGLPDGAGGLLYASAPFSSTRFNGNVVRAGINYHFSWGLPSPVVAKY